MAFVGPEGFIGKYRKTHSFISETLWAKDGDLGFPVFSTEIGNLGGLICMDASFPEAARVLTLKGADVICFPTNWCNEKAPDPSWMARSFENGVYMIAADRWGNERTVEFSGGSVIIGPDGSIQSHIDNGNGIIYGVVDIQKARDKTFGEKIGGDKFQDRRPIEYSTIVQNSYLYSPMEFFTLYGRPGLPKGKKSSITVIQLNSIVGDYKANLGKLEKLFDNVPSESELVVLPELAVSGYPDSPDEARKMAENLSISSTINSLTKISRKFDLYIVTSVIEETEQEFFNTAVVIGKDGILGSYRKLHLTVEERKWAKPGDNGITALDLPLGRIGLMLGYDSIFPEMARCLAIQGVDLICIPGAMSFPAPTFMGPTTIPLPKEIDRGSSHIHWHLIRCRCEENNTMVAFANHTGGSYFGRSGIFSPRREGEPRYEKVALFDNDEIITLQMDTSSLDGVLYPTSLIRNKELIRMRLPHWYDQIVMPKY